MSELDLSQVEYGLSKTEVKKGFQRLQGLIEPLSQLSKKQVKKLPASEFFIEELTELQQISSNEARKRHIKRLTKLLDEEEQQYQIIQTLFAMRYSDSQQSKTMSWVQRLSLHDANTITQFTKQFWAAELNTTRQLLLNVALAQANHDDEKLEFWQDALNAYVCEVAILSNL